MNYVLDQSISSYRQQRQLQVTDFDADTCSINLVNEYHPGYYSSSVSLECLIHIHQQQLSVAVDISFKGKGRMGVLLCHN